MYTVLLNSRNEGHSFQSFYHKFLEICESHKKSDRALAFAFILYDFENPQIAKVLKDTAYWMSLNEISGKYLTVFSFHYKPKIRFNRPRRRSNENSMEYLTLTSTFNNPSYESNLLMEKYFGAGIQVTYPSVLFFQVHDEKVIDYTLIKLDEQNIEGAFLELKSYIKTAVETLKRISDENKANSKEIFDLVQGNVKDLRKLVITKRAIKKITSITELASSVVGLGS